MVFTYEMGYLEDKGLHIKDGHSRKAGFEIIPYPLRGQITTPGTPKEAADGSVLFSWVVCFPSQFVYKFEKHAAWVLWGT
jgi:hypothetical protein